MVKYDLDIDKLKELYADNRTHAEIAAALGVGRTCIDQRIKKMIKAGILEPRERGYKQIVLSDQLKEEIVKLVKLGKSREEIAAALDLSMATLYKYQKIIFEEYGLNIRKRKKPTRFIAVNSSVKVDSTLAPGETIECCRKVARTCVYGCSGDSKWLCNYALITKECRSLGPDGCDYKACTKYSKIGPHNPRLEVKEF